MHRNLLARSMRVFHPITSSCEYHTVSVLPEPHPHLMQAGMRVLWLKAKKVSAVEMVGEFGHQPFKTFLRSKELILPSGHGCDALGGILAHGLPGHFHEPKYVKIPPGRVGARIPLAAQGVYRC